MILILTRRKIIKYSPFHRYTSFQEKYAYTAQHKIQYTSTASHWWQNVKRTKLNAKCIKMKLWRSIINELFYFLAT